MVEISVIIPVYNVEKQIERCIDSVLAQSYGEFEIILVDDGSTDLSGEICDSYAQKDSRIKVIHKNNGGVSSARNLGISHAKGEYIHFIDGDDWIDSGLFHDIYEQIEGSRADIIFFGFKYEDEDGNLIKVKKLDKTVSSSNNLEKYTIQLYKNDLYGYTWCKWYRRDVIKENNIFFDEKISYCEDEKFTCEYYKYVKKLIIYSNNTYYHYVRYTKERKSLCTTVNTGDMEMRNDVFKAWLEMLENYNDDEIYQYLMERANVNLRYLFSNIIYGEYSYREQKVEIKKLKNTLFYESVSKNNKILPFLWFIKYEVILGYKIYTYISYKVRFLLK